MYSSRMRTACSLMYRKGVGSLSKGGEVICPWEGLCPGRSLSGRPPPPVNRMIDRCNNITLPQTSFCLRAVITLLWSPTHKYIHLSYISECLICTFLVNLCIKYMYCTIYITYATPSILDPKLSCTKLRFHKLIANNIYGRHCINIGFEALTAIHWNCCNQEILTRLAPHYMAIMIGDLR